MMAEYSRLIGDSDRELQALRAHFQQVNVHTDESSTPFDHWLIDFFSALFGKRPGGT